MKLINSLKKRFGALRRFPTLGRYRGARFILDPKNWIDKRLVSGVAFESKQLNAAMDIVAANGIDIFIDIGANLGLYTAIIGRMDQIRHVHAFEPVRRNISQLYGNIFANGLWNKAIVHPVGLSDRAFEAVIHIDPTSTGVSRLNLETALRDTKVFTETETIRVIAFDEVSEFSDARGKRPFIKIDVEGEAASVLAGMKTFLTNNDCFLQIEMTSTELSDGLKIMDGLGYRRTGDIEGDYYFCKRKGTP